MLIIPSLIAFYGFGSGGGSKTLGHAQVVATIDYPNGSDGKISGVELRQAKNFLEDRLARYGQDQGILLDETAVTELTKDKAILDQAINLDILRHYAEVNNITVTSEEVIKSIQELTTPEQRQMLQQKWAQEGRSVDSVVEDERKGRLLAKASDSIGAQTRVTHYEAWQDYLKDNQQLVVDTYKINPSDFTSSVTVTDEGLKAYYEENKEKFRIPDQVQYQYVITRKDDLKSSVTLTDDEITSYYTNNKEEFRLPRKVEANQIFLKLPDPQDMKTTSAEAFTSMTEAVTAKANDIYERAAKGEAFATLADSYNEEVNFPPRADEGTTASDTATTAGGHLGLISEDVAKTWYGDAWTSAVFAAQPGSITRPIRTTNGYAVVQVQKIIEGDIQPLDQVRPVIENRLRDQKVEPIFEAIGNRLLDITGNVTGLQQIAEATSGTVATSGKVNKRDKFIPGIGLLGDFEEAIADLQKGGHSDVLSDSQRHLVIEIKEEFPTHIPELQEVKGRVEQAYKQKLADDAAKAKADDLFKKSTSFDSFVKALSDLGTTYTHSKPFKRPEAAGVFGGPVADFSKNSVGVAKGDIKMATVGRSGQQQSYVIWHVDQVIEPSKTEFARDLGKISDRLTERKKQILVLEYMRDERAKLNDRIEIDENYR